MSLGLTALVLLAALLHATWNALIKSGRDRLMSLIIMMNVGSLLAFPALFLVPLPRPESWIFLLLSTVLHWGYFYALLEGYRVGDLSHVYPVARGVAPIMVAALAWAVAGEGLTPWSTVGLLLASGAIASLAFASAGSFLANPRPFLYGLLTGAFIAAYTVVDGFGVRRAGTELSYIAWLFFIDAPLLWLILLRKRRGRIKPYLEQHGGTLALGGGLTALAYGIVIWALAHAPMAFVSALRETSVVFAAILGATVLREAFGPRRVVAAVMVVAGVALLHGGA